MTESLSPGVSWKEAVTVLCHYYGPQPQQDGLADSSSPQETLPHWRAVKSPGKAAQPGPRNAVQQWSVR